MAKQTYIRLTNSNLEYINKLSKEKGLTRNAVLNEIIHSSKLLNLGIVDVSALNTTQSTPKKEKQK